ncbi:MFS transporter [bacterium]|nr:MFS transporter [bacterium]
MTNKPKGMRTFLTIWIGQLMSMLGSGLISFALAVWIFDQTGQATPFALTALFGTLPRILLSPIAGAVVDRRNRKMIMLVSDSLAGVLTLATAVLLLTGQMQIWMIYLISFFESVFAAFQGPAYSASVVMLVPKKQLTRANSMLQMGEAIQAIITPILAGALFTTIGMTGIIIIDAVTYLFALFTLIIVRIPQPEPAKKTRDQTQSMLKDVAFGWRYLVDRPGLMGLIWYFAVVNFLLNISSVMIGPLILSFGNATSLGLVQTIQGAGLLAGSILMSVWGGPKRHRVGFLILFIFLASLGYLVAGSSPTVVAICAGIFILLFFIPFGSSTSSALFALKVAPDVQGRVFATRSMISQSMTPLAFVLSGVLADNVFNPLMMKGGALADTFVGRWIGVGPGRGIGLMLISSGILLLIVSGIAFANRHIRRLEVEIPDVVVQPDNEDDDAALPAPLSQEADPA